MDVEIVCLQVEDLELSEIRRSCQGLGPAALEASAFQSQSNETAQMRRLDQCFDSRVTAARFDGEADQWEIECADGHSVRTRFFIPWTGFAAKAYIPDLPGLEAFVGPSVHTSHWPQGGGYFPARI